MSTDYIQRALERAKAGDKQAAKSILAQAIKTNRDDAAAWYLLSQVADNPGQAAYCLGQVIRIQPGNIQAKQRLEKLNIVPESRLPEMIPTPKQKFWRWDNPNARIVGALLYMAAEFWSVCRYENQTLLFITIALAVGVAVLIVLNQRVLAALGVMAGFGVWILSYFI